jgi:diguanylate cyclase (GGDEF)-like protein/PAS domain S-box-containing protein
MSASLQEPETARPGFEAALRRALLDSRQRYKDLLEIAADVVWETDADGRIVFVRPDHVLGFSSEMVLGNSIRDLAPDGNVPSVFAARAPMRAVDVWLRGADGEVHCLSTSALPIVDEQGAWIGARGVCRDVTVERARERALAENGARERLTAHFLTILRDESNPRAALQRGLTALVNALGASGGRIASTDGEPPITVGTASGERAECFIRWAGRDLGSLEFWRTTPFGEADSQLLGDAELQVAGALAHAAAQQRLVALARIDDRTGLLNRRAFLEELAGRRTLHGVLLYLDLDGFKAINDRMGHAAGDAVLAAVGDVLRGNTRPGDLAARLGGDEFAVWLDRIASGDAQAIAARLRNGIISAGERFGGAATDLNVSIGIASDAATPEMLLAAADTAMYEAKRAGRGLLREARP